MLAGVGRSITLSERADVGSRCEVDAIGAMAAGWSAVAISRAITPSVGNSWRAGREAASRAQNHQWGDGDFFSFVPISYPSNHHVRITFMRYENLALGLCLRWDDRPKNERGTREAGNVVGWEAGRSVQLVRYLRSSSPASFVGNSG